MKMAFGRAGRNDDLLREISEVRATLFVKLDFGGGVKIDFGGEGNDDLLRLISGGE
jgi:hypothetical protein